MYIYMVFPFSLALSETSECGSQGKILSSSAALRTHERVHAQQVLSAVTGADQKNLQA